MNPETNEFERLAQLDELRGEAEKRARGQLEEKLRELQAHADTQGNTPQLYRPDGRSVPEHWSVFKVGEHIVIKNYTFKVAHIGESHILFEPVGPVLLDTDREGGG